MCMCVCVEKRGRPVSGVFTVLRSTQSVTFNGKSDANENLTFNGKSDVQRQNLTFSEKSDVQRTTWRQAENLSLTLRSFALLRHTDAERRFLTRRCSSTRTWFS